MNGLERVLPLQEFRGLRPQAWICVGAGFSREDIKSFLLAHDVPFIGDTVQSFAGLALKVAGVDSSKVLSSLARQEVLRVILSQPGLRERFPELKRLKRQGTFLRRLDHAVQAGRMAFAHWEEARVYSERLTQRLGANPLRAEIEILARGYEVWLEQKGFWDPPLALRRAIEKLQAGEALELPRTIYALSARAEESLERSFWEALEHRTKVVKIGAQEITSSAGISSRFSWERWHTLDDAAEKLSESCAAEISAGRRLSETVTLISDVPSSRRTLKRALDASGVLLSDPRDPTRLRWDEAVKWALLPLELSARSFERARVIAFVHQFARGTESEKATWVREISERGVRSGLDSYQGGKLVLLHSQLSELSGLLGKKRTAQELGQAHLQYLTSHVREEQSWIVAFFETLWKLMIEDLDRVDLATRRAASMYWLERLQSRVQEAPAPVEKIKPVGGLDVYRMHQAPSRSYERVYVFGISAQWLSGEGGGDYWFSEREREILASEFSVRSTMQIREERTSALRSWLASAREVCFLDAQYDPDGRERESILPVVQGFWPEAQTEEKGSHPRWTASFSALRPSQPQAAKLPPIAPQQGAEKPVISASALENYSRCGFLALARQRWRIDDLSEPDTDLWPHVKGSLLHEAVRLLVESRDEDGNFSKTAEEAIDQAWEAHPPRGLVRGVRIESYVKRRLATLLRVFQEQERKYVQRARTRVLALENVELRMEYPEFSVVGEPDRIDEHPDGVWVIDYKTSSSAPNGAVMLENGYRLQLPYYALAARKKFGKEALGFQFVQLDRKGTRTNGVYFKSHNGKEPGKLTQTTAASKSLLNLPREEVWSRFEEQVRRTGTDYVRGVFEAKPRISPRSKECESCSVSDLCGYRRLLEEPSEEGGLSG